LKTSRKKYLIANISLVHAQTKACLGIAYRNEILGLQSFYTYYKQLFGR